MKKLLFITSILFTEEVSIAAKYPLIYEAMQTEQGANNLVDITESNYESKTKDMKENIFMQPAKNIIFFNDFVPWNPIFVWKCGNNYISFCKKSNLFLYPLIISIPDEGVRSICMSIVILNHILGNLATSYYNISSIHKNQELLNFLKYNANQILSILLFINDIYMLFILIWINFVMYSLYNNGGGRQNYIINYNQFKLFDYI